MLLEEDSRVITRRAAFYSLNDAYLAYRQGLDEEKFQPSDHDPSAVRPKSAGLDR
jgi:hypothetical protein